LTIAFTAFDDSIQPEEDLMTKPLLIAKPATKRIKPSEPGVRRLDPEAVAAALGGEPCPEEIRGQPGPITLFALRTELANRRQSSGGRPGIEGTNFRAKIPVGDREWHRLESIAHELSAQGFSPSAGQVASVLLSLALRSISSGSRQEEQPTASTAAVAKEMARRMQGEKQQR
jgi:hypothetical protein